MWCSGSAPGWPRCPVRRYSWGRGFDPRHWQELLLSQHKGCRLAAPFIPDAVGGIMYNTRAVGHGSIHSWSRCNCALSKKPSWWETVESFSVGKFGTKTTSSLWNHYHGTSNKNVHICNLLLSFRWPKSFQAWDILFLCMKLADVFDFELNEM